MRVVSDPLGYVVLLNLIYKRNWPGSLEIHSNVNKLSSALKMDIGDASQLFAQL